MFKRILLFLGAWKIYIFLLTFLATFVLPFKNTFTPYGQGFRDNIPYLLAITANFDGYFYMKIAQEWYIPSRLPFFPLYPLLIRLIHDVTRLPYLYSGLIISYITFGISVFLFYKLFLIDTKKKSLFFLFLCTLVFFPTSYSYTNVYNDSLFLSLSLATLYFGRQQRWVYASIFGLLATLTRLNGLALFFFIVPEYIVTTLPKTLDTYSLKKLQKVFWERIQPQKIIKSGILMAGLIPLAYFSYLYYINTVFGNWKMIYKAMDVWRQNVPTFPLQVFWRYFKIFALYRPFDMLYLVAVLEFLFILFYIAVIIYSFKKIRLSYWILFLVTIIIPATTGTFAGMPRYALHLYPFFLALTLFLEHKSIVVKAICVGIFIVLSFICLTLFTRGYFIA